ncbi:Hypothetical predicted protein [Olea europaea subsp. europaea]|uniref:Uncharacterized protein n=1 Tax=Olea europaea subsp. europaea TaxID=158383 RepID=A0A8S0QXX5_OLEEU|nr:Hypothetical predicted protein [Olea europaea subsp. europaea]
MLCLIFNFSKYFFFCPLYNHTFIVQIILHLFLPHIFHKNGLIHSLNCSILDFASQLYIIHIPLLHSVSPFLPPPVIHHKLLLLSSLANLGMEFRGGKRRDRGIAVENGSTALQYLGLDREKSSLVFDESKNRNFLLKRLRRS